jgi:hypothetical protein
MNSELTEFAENNIVKSNNNFNLISDIQLTNMDQNVAPHLTIDMDSLFGLADIREFSKNFKTNIVLEICEDLKINFHGNKIVSKMMVQTCNGSKRIETLYYSKLGKALTEFGPLSIFIVFIKFNKNDQHLYSSYIFDFVNSLLKKKNSENICKQFIRINEDTPRGKMIEGNLLVSSFSFFFENMADEFEGYEPKIYFESFGNKDQTTTSFEKVQTIQSFITKSFSDNFLDNIFVDICFALSAGDDMITFAKTNLFDKLNIKPNYTPCLSNSILNYNSSTVDSKGKINNIGRYFMSSKLNFYSSFKRIIGFIKPSLFECPLTSALLGGIIYGCRIQGRPDKVQKIFSEYKKIKQMYDECASKTYPYRMEFRISYNNLYCLHNKVKDIFIGEYFAYCKSNQFFNLLDQNINSFLETIFLGNREDNQELYTFEDIFHSIIYEFIFTNIYLNGMCKISFFGNEINSKITEALNKLRSKNIPKIDVKRIFGTELNEMLFCVKKDVLIRFLTYVKDLPKPEKEMTMEVVDNYFDTNAGLDEYILRLINLYVLSVTYDEKYTYKSLKAAPPDDSKATTFIGFIKKCFVLLHSEAKATPVNVFFRMLLQKFKLNEDNLIDMMKKFFIKNKLISCIGGKVWSGNSLDLIKINFQTKITEEEIFWEMKLNFIKKFASMASADQISLSVSKDEFLRCFHALYTYKDTTASIQNCINDFSYGFYPLRNSDWVKNRANYLISITKSKEDFINFIHKVKTWHPMLIGVNERVDLLLSKLKLDSNDIETYCELLKNDIKQWFKTDIYIKIKEPTGAEIFKTIVGERHKYQMVHEKLAEYCADENVNIETDNVVANIDGYMLLLKKSLLKKVLNQTVQVKVPGISKFITLPLEQQILIYKDEVSANPVLNNDMISLNSINDSVDKLCEDKNVVYPSLISTAPTTSDTLESVFDAMSMQEENNDDFLNGNFDDFNDSFFEADPQHNMQDYTDAKKYKKDENKVIETLHNLNDDFSKRKNLDLNENNVKHDKPVENKLFLKKILMKKYNFKKFIDPGSRVQHYCDSIAFDVKSSADISNNLITDGLNIENLEKFSEKCLMWKNNLFKKYKFKKFKFSAARVSSFTLKKRPELDEWAKFESNLLLSNEVCKIRSGKSFVYAFNIPTKEKNVFLDYQKMIETLRMLANPSLENDRVFNEHFDKKILKSDYDLLIACLVDDQILALANNSEDKKIYDFIN